MPGGGPTLEGARVYELACFSQACFDAARWYESSDDKERGPLLARQLAENGLWAIEQAVAVYTRAADVAQKRVDSVNESIRAGRIPQADGPVTVRFAAGPPGVRLDRVFRPAPTLAGSNGTDTVVHTLTPEQLAEFDEISRRQALKPEEF